MRLWVLLSFGWLLIVRAVDGSIRRQHGQALTVTSSAGSHCNDLPAASRARQAHLHPARIEDQISVVLLNWLRPANVVEVLEAMVAYPEARLLETACCFEIYSRFGSAKTQQHSQGCHIQTMSSSEAGMYLVHCWLLRAARSRAEVYQNVVLQNCNDSVVAPKAHSNVEEIVVMQNRNDSAVAFVHPKVKLLDSASLYANWHMTSRLKGCLLTASSWVLLVDDDLILSRQALQRLMAAKRAQPDRVYGLFARGYNDSDPHYTYDLVEPGETQVAIGRTMFVDHGMCRLFFELSGLMNDVAMEGHTRWGAEDIFLSLAVRALSGHKPYVLPLEPGDVKDLPDLAVGISRHNTHLQFRDRFLRTAVERLSCFFTNIPQPASIVQHLMSSTPAAGSVQP